MENEKKITTIIDDIQESQILCGGKFLRQSEIKEMTVDELLHLLIPNGVDFNVSFERNK